MYDTSNVDVAVTVTVELVLEEVIVLFTSRVDE